MGDTERKQIPLRVSASQKKNWEQYQEELGYGSREAMIRRAVEYFYAVKTGKGGDELAEEVSSQLGRIQDRLDILRADVGDVRREQLTTDDIDDIAEEFAYTLSKDDLRAPESFTEDSILLGPDADEGEVVRATEHFLQGFSQAVASIEDPEERERMEGLMEEQRDKLYEDHEDAVE